MRVHTHKKYNMNFIMCVFNINIAKIRSNRSNRSNKHLLALENKALQLLLLNENPLKLVVTREIRSNKNINICLE